MGECKMYWESISYGVVYLKIVWLLKVVSKPLINLVGSMNKLACIVPHRCTKGGHKGYWTRVWLAKYTYEMCTILTGFVGLIKLNKD